MNIKEVKEIIQYCQECNSCNECKYLESYNCVENCKFRIGDFSSAILQELANKAEQIECLEHNLKVKQSFNDNQYNNYLKIVKEKDKKIEQLEYENKTLKAFASEVFNEEEISLINELEQENKQLKQFFKESTAEQIRILLAKYWLTHANDEVFETFGFSYVPNTEYQKKAREIVDINQLDIFKTIDSELLTKNIIKNILAGATTYGIN